jgi:hypothetical protein
VKKFETNRPVDAIVDDLVGHLRPDLCLPSLTAGGVVGRV